MAEFVKKAEVQARSSDLYGCFPLLLLLIASMIAMIVVFGGVGQELTPDHPSDEMWSLAISLALGVICLIVMLRPKPGGARDVSAAIIWSGVVAFLYLPVSGMMLQRIHEIVDFSVLPSRQAVRFLPIEHAAIHTGRGTSYEIRLTEYPVILTIDKSDYLSAFGEIKRLRPIGYCVRATVEWTTGASRVLALPGRNLPQGSLVRCAGNVRS